ncbi:MAG TPA: N-acetylmuramoyl-L-alanine amidase [Candidatus Levilactobacillus faecigallinarum]|uniref:N-acetylmuramoyl-L-alanine amidase n=1 Tax=Candidatus Levilactobacillus faecigallinarum TaxID=2838638 RepID=A0A9D1QTX5_9LACO|nr:N-acetylmuramoyl-L-alanine amidase [Candidatus Levilactobacillus faecigallinarum]
MFRKWQHGLAVLALVLPLIGGLATTVPAQAVSKTATVKKTTPAKHHYLLVMGHGAGDAGARGNGTTEATALRKIFLPELKKYAKQVQHSTITFYNPKRNLVTDTLQRHQGSYKINKHTTVIMFHLDAPSGHGGHVIISKRHPTARDRRLAKVIKKYVGLNRAYMGYSYRTNLRNCNVLRRRGIDYSLVESGFITNKTDYQRLKKHRAQIAKSDIEAITNEKLPANAK